MEENCICIPTIVFVGIYVMKYSERWRYKLCFENFASAFFHYIESHL